ncbi:MAG: hypothetical protein QHI48_10965 [Bacteroidota bacterium]|nr:hypothetical protein [Bacteroidota bacterium]
MQRSIIVRGAILLAVSSFVFSVRYSDVTRAWRAFAASAADRIAASWAQMRGPHALAAGIEFFVRSRLVGMGEADIGKLWVAAWEDARNRSLRKAGGELAWQFIGPSNIAGRIRSLALDPSDPRRIYAGSATGGVFRTTDGGALWQALMDDAPSLSIGAIAVDHKNPSILFAGTGEATVPLSRAAAAPVFSGVGVLRSSDGGTTWTVLPWPAPTSAVSRIVLHPVSSDTLLVATRQGLWKSTNSGDSWVNVLAGVVTDVAYAEDDPATVFAAIGNDFGDPRNGVYRSDAGGRAFTWKKLSDNFPAADSIGRLLLATTPAAPGLLLALAARPITEDNFRALLRSTDRGERWERITTNLPFDFPQGQAFYNFCIAVSPVDPNLVFVGGVEVYRSTDGGSSFTRMTFANQVVHVDQHALVFDASGDILYAANDGGVFRTGDRGMTWKRLDSSLATVQFYRIIADPTFPGLFYGGTQDNGSMRLTTPSNVWRIIRGDVDGGDIQSDGVNLYAMVTTSIYPARSTDGGRTWAALHEGLGSGNRPNWLQPLRIHPADRNRIYTATQYVFEAKDAASPTGPTPWRAISPDLTTASGVFESVVSALAVAPSNSACMYAVTGDGRAHRTDNLLSPSPLWTDISHGLPSRWISDIAVHALDDGKAVAVCSGFGTGHVFLTHDGGASWEDVSGNLPDIPVNAVVFAGDNIVVGTDLGVWVSSGNCSWERFGTGLPNVIVYDLAIDGRNRLVAATHGRGAWILEIPTGFSLPPAPPRHVHVEIRSPVRLSEGRVLPLTVTTDKPSDIVVTLFDYAGRKAKSMNVTAAGAGAQRIEFPLEGVGSGVFFVHVRTQHGQTWGKTLLLP